MFGGTADNTRYSALRQINAADVAGLRVAWTRTEGFGQSTWESFPVVVGTTMYLTTSTGTVWALNAVTGALRWSYAPRVDFFPMTSSQSQGSYFPANRGVAVADGVVYELTFDCRLLALDAATGRPRWLVQVADPRQGYYETTAPIVWNGIVFAGSSGGDSGVRGFIAAYDARTGRQIWRRYTVPAPGHGWVPATGHHGGGAVWMPPVIDQSAGILYAATGNPSPDYDSTRAGAAPDTDGILALRARTGAPVWFTSLVSRDVSDHDAASPVVLLRGVRAVGEAGKSGLFYLLDAATGRPLFRPVRFVTTGSAVLPTLNRGDPSPRTPRGGATPGSPAAVTCPGELGGSNYSPLAYDPGTHAVYVSGIDYCGEYHPGSPAEAATHQAGVPDLGGSVQPAQASASGTFTAIDVTTGRVRWQRAMPAPMLGGATAAGGLVFAGAVSGVCYAFDAATGQIRWQRDLGAGFGSAPVVYAVGGREYLAVVSGGAAIAAINQLGPVGGHLYVFTVPT
ncbi:MAG: PQQ-binding-like beta-propeller repeat protein [Streptosporangiaceae bacterium]|nr:PQQ-binding-like beta-propeller repeat protein [Streptosporangiaceae bacterium]